VIFRQDVPSRYRAPVSPSRRLARSALPRERFRSLTHSDIRDVKMLQRGRSPSPKGRAIYST